MGASVEDSHTQDAIVSHMDTTTDTRLVRHVVVTVLLAATAVVVGSPPQAWGLAGMRQVGFPVPTMGGQPCRQSPGLAREL
jgi:hypothetical protein